MTTINSNILHRNFYKSQAPRLLHVYWLALSLQYIYIYSTEAAHVRSSRLEHCIVFAFSILWMLSIILIRTVQLSQYLSTRYTTSPWHTKWIRALFHLCHRSPVRKNFTNLNLRTPPFPWSLSQFLTALLIFTVIKLAHIGVQVQESWNTRRPVHSLLWLSPSRPLLEPNA